MAELAPLGLYMHRNCWTECTEPSGCAGRRFDKHNPVPARFSVDFAAVCSSLVPVEA